MDSPSTPALILDAANRASAYAATVDDRLVFPPPEALAALVALGGPTPENPTDSAAILDLLDRHGSPATVASTGGRYFGFVIGGALPASLATNILTAAWDQNAGMRIMSPVAAALEDIALGWLIDLLCLPTGVSGGFVTGATMANFTCLAAARNAILARHGWDVESKGLFGAPPIPVIVSEESHVTVHKALALLGMGRDRVHVVPSDAQGRLTAAALPRLNEPSILCIQAGNVNTGAFDPIRAVCEAARETGSWVHIDGAFGLWAAASPSYAALMDGADLADSWATDAHKWLNVPYDSGLAFTRHPESAFRSMNLQAAYLHAGADREPCHYTPDASRRARGAEVWAALRSLGRTGLAAMIDRCCAHAARFAEGLSAAGFEILNEVVLNQVLVSFGDDDRTRRVIAAVQAEGTCWCGGTVWKGRAAMRISVSSWATTEDDVEKSLAAILRAAA